MQTFTFLNFLVSFQSKLGDIVYVQLPDVGETVTEGGKKPKKLSVTLQN